MHTPTRTRILTAKSRRSALCVQAHTAHTLPHLCLHAAASQARFSAVGDAYEILKSPEKRKEYDTYGRLGTAASQGRGANYGSQEEMFREFMRRYGQEQEMEERRPPPKPFPQPEMEAWILADPTSIERASRACGFSTEKDAIRASFAGKLGCRARARGGASSPRPTQTNRYPDESLPLAG